MPINTMIKAQAKAEAEKAKQAKAEAEKNNIPSDITANDVTLHPMWVKYVNDNDITRDDLVNYLLKMSKLPNMGQVNDFSIISKFLSYDDSYNNAPTEGVGSKLIKKANSDGYLHPDHQSITISDIKGLLKRGKLYDGLIEILLPDQSADLVLGGKIQNMLGDKPGDIMDKRTAAGKIYDALKELKVTGYSYLLGSTVITPKQQEMVDGELLSKNIDKKGHIPFYTNLDTIKQDDTDYNYPSAVVIPDLNDAKVNMTRAEKNAIAIAANRPNPGEMIDMAPIFGGGSKGSGGGSVGSKAKFGGGDSESEKTKSAKITKYIEALLGSKKDKSEDKGKDKDDDKSEDKGKVGRPRANSTISTMMKSKGFDQNSGFIETMKYLYNRTKNLDVKLKMLDDINTLTPDQLQKKYGKYQEVYEQQIKQDKEDVDHLIALKNSFLKNMLQRKERRARKK